MAVHVSFLRRPLQDKNVKIPNFVFSRAPGVVWRTYTTTAEFLTFYFEFTAVFRI